MAQSPGSAAPFTTLAPGLTVALPLFLGAGRGSTFACLALGVRVILEPKFDPVRLLDIVTREKVTTFSLVPTAFQSLVDVVGEVRFDGRSPATSAAYCGEWFRTGDIGCVDRDGFLFLRGRIKNLIKSGGRSIFPDEVEAALLGHPHVQEVGVFGVPGPKWCEAVHPAVVPKPGGAPSPEDLLEFCAAHLSRHKRPKRIHVMTGLPRGNLMLSYKNSRIVKKAFPRL